MNGASHYQDDLSEQATLGSYEASDVVDVYHNQKS